MAARTGIAPTLIGPLRSGAWAALALLAATACAPLPAQQAAGTPAARIAAESLATLRAGEATVGAAVAVDQRHLLTNAHVLRQAGAGLRLRSADGVREAPAEVVAVSPRLDLAVLRMPAGFLAPARAGEAPESGHEVWAVGPEGLGRALAAGRVRRSDHELAGFGPGFTAGLGALMGFSGGPVVDRDGRLVGLTTALPDSGRAGLVAALTGVDVAGFSQGAAREVFALGIREALDEARRIAPELSRAAGETAPPLVAAALR